jgi:hypothetical protein
VSLRTEFQSLGTQMKRLRKAFSELRRLIDDHPAQGDNLLLLDAFGDAVEDVLGWLKEALEAAAPLLQPQTSNAGEQGFDINLARQALVVCHDQFNRVTHRFSFDLVSYDKVAQLLRLGRERRGEWQTWARGIKMELESCQQHLYHTNQALFRCWLEIAERVGMTSVSVQATNIGQQVTVPQNPELTAEGMT